MNRLHPTLEQLVQDIRQRSKTTRADYLQRMQVTRDTDPPKRQLSCGNLAHGFAACNAQDKQTIRLMQSANIGIVTAYNDMLSAHQPFASYPDFIKQCANRLGSTAQVAGGVPAMCDGVTQGQAGMEMSLFSRDVIALATAISLSHNLFDAALCLGVCDKIVPGMLIGALEFGHLPVGFIPAGPMPSGISNKEKALVRQRYADGNASDAELLAAESAAYHSPGTCTFYGTANTNQLLMEVLGVQLPGASFINPDDPLRPALTQAMVEKVVRAAERPAQFCLANIVNEAAIVNALVALLASGGSTNHTLHLVAIARAAGIQLTWQDFATASAVVPQLVQVYPNGNEDINAFQRAGGTAFLFRELRQTGLLNDAVNTLMGEGLAAYELQPTLNAEQVNWNTRIEHSQLAEVLRPAAQPFAQEGGIRLLTGNLGECVTKVSAVKPEHRRISAPCIVFESQAELQTQFKAGALEKDFIAVVRFQGPQANGMPELHQLTPYLGALQDRGFKVALVTDGRMSGASGKVPAAIHLTPEALDGGPLARVRSGDLLTFDANAGTLNTHCDAATLAAREPVTAPHITQTLGRNLFARFRQFSGKASDGASVFEY